MSGASPSEPREAIAAPVRAMGDGPLSEAALREHAFPLFSRVLSRPDHPALGRPEVYLANHSLGRPLDATAEDLRAAVDLWYADLDGAWDAWTGAIDRFRALTARLVGAPAPDRIVPKTNAGQGLRAALNALPSLRPRVVATAGEFDSIDVILKAYRDRGRADVRFVPPRAGGLFDVEDVADAIDEETDLVVVSLGVFATSQLLPGVGEVIDRAHDVGARVLLDVYHGAGVIPFDLVALKADFAIGGSYKYTRGGPGACWLYVSDAALDDPTVRPIDTGWFAKAEPFAYDRADETVFAPGGDGWLESTPPFLMPYQALAGLEFTLAVGVARLRAHNLVQQEVLADALRERGVEPRLIEPRGAFLLVPSDDAPGLCAALRERGVNTDARGGAVRFGPDALNTEDELRLAAQICAEAIGAQAESQ